MKVNTFYSWKSYALKTKGGREETLLRAAKIQKSEIKQPHNYRIVFFWMTYAKRLYKNGQGTTYLIP